MKFPRNARVSTGRLDATPFITVFFLLVMFVILSTLIYTPGVPMKLELPSLGIDLAGTDKPTTSIAIDANGTLYFQNQIIQRRDLRERLKGLVAKSPEPMVLIVQADRSVSHEALVRLAVLARDSGFKEARLAVLPRSLDMPHLPAQKGK